MNLRFGKHPPKIDYRTLRLKKYLLSTLPEPPEEFDMLDRVYKNIGINDPTVLFPMYANDKYGDCAIAAIGHASTVSNGMVSVKHLWNDTDCVKTYFKLTGGVDSGLVELDVLNYWRKNTVAGSKILGFAAIDHRNHTHIKQAIQLFGGVYLGFQCTESTIDQFERGEEWTQDYLTNDGHAVFATSYDKDSISVLTWGTVQKGTWDWWDECVDESYAIIPHAALLDQFNHVDFEQLKNDLNKIAS